MMIDGNWISEKVGKLYGIRLILGELYNKGLSRLAPFQARLVLESPQVEALALATVVVAVS